MLYGNHFLFFVFCIDTKILHNTQIILRIPSDKLHSRYLRGVGCCCGFTFFDDLRVDRLQIIVIKNNSIFIIRFLIAIRNIVCLRIIFRHTSFFTYDQQFTGIGRRCSCRRAGFLMIITRIVVYSVAKRQWCNILILTGNGQYTNITVFKCIILNLSDGLR